MEKRRGNRPISSTESLAGDSHNTLVSTPRCSLIVAHTLYAHNTEYDATEISHLRGHLKSPSVRFGNFLTKAHQFSLMHYPLSDEQSDRVVVGLENVHTFEELTVTEEGLMFLSGTISFSATTLELDQKRNVSAPLNVTDCSNCTSRKIILKTRLY